MGKDLILKIIGASIAIIVVMTIVQFALFNSMKNENKQALEIVNKKIEELDKKADSLSIIQDKKESAIKRVDARIINLKNNRNEKIVKAKDIVNSVSSDWELDSLVSRQLQD